jgi:glutamyl-tRNA reductase
MPLLTIGISHHTAPIEIRERVALSPGDRWSKLKSALTIDGVDEALLLSTCNRTELYCYGPRPEMTALLDWVHRAWKLGNDRLDAFFYCLGDEDAVRHLIRVAGGMDSMVLGESQILGQLKEAWKEAREAGTVGNTIDRLCQHAVATAKSIRHQTSIGDKPISVAYTAIVLARRLFSDLESRRVLLIGAGEMIELCARHLNQHGVSRLSIANRDPAKAARLAAELGASPVALADLDDVLPSADILITSTASDHPVVTLKAVKKALSARRHKPMFIVDIAVPRDVEPAVEELDDVYLYTIDDLQQVVNENLQQRNLAAQAAEPEVDAAVDDFIRWMKGSRAVDTLQLMRERAHQHSRDLVDRAMRRLHAGHDPQAVLEQLGTTLTNRILHAPSKHLRHAAEQNDLELIASIHRIYTPEGGDDEDPEVSDVENGEPVRGTR